jgi:hypothetical protein
MKRTTIVLAIAGYVAVLCSTGIATERALAVSGCCKQRDAIERAWEKNGKSFGECEKQNSEWDRGDNIFLQAGRVWWDVGC